MYRNFATALIAFLPLVSIGQPSPAARWLMSEPMSLFDWGIYRLERRLSAMGSGTPPATLPYLLGVIAYDGSTNRIRVVSTFVGAGTEAECIDSLRRVKSVLVPFGMSEVERNKSAPAVFADLFGHVGGYGTSEPPSNVGEELANSVFIEVRINRKDDVLSFKPAVICSGNFRSTVISVGGE
jgi:hypothetical protein